MADLDTTTRPANGRLALDNALANGRFEGQDIPSTGNSSPPPTPAAATFDARCGVFTARLYANSGCRRLTPVTDTTPTHPARGCLPNRLDITDPAVLVRVGGAASCRREGFLNRERPDLRRFDLDHLRGVHRWSFADAYAWAGELRTVNLAKGLTGSALAENLGAKARRIIACPATDRWLPDPDGTASVPKPPASSPT